MMTKKKYNYASVHTVLPLEVRDRFRNISKQKGITQSSVITTAIRDFIKKYS